MRRNETNRKLYTVSGSMILLLIVAESSSGQVDQSERWENGVSNSWSLPDAPKEELESLKSRWTAIEQELKHPTNEFAGTYVVGGEMRQSILRWAPDNGFVYVYVYERLDVIDFSYGRVKITPSEITFIIEREQRSKDQENQLRMTPSRWIPAKWKNRRYMIQIERIADFGNYVAGFNAYNDFNGPCCEFIPFFVLGGDDNSGGIYQKPSVPKEYEAFIKSPIEATIISVGKRRIVKDYGSEGELYGHLHLLASLTSVRIDVGRRLGVKRDMLFRLVEQPDFWQYLKVTRVGEDFSEGVVVRDLDDSGQETYLVELNPERRKAFPPIKIGLKVTTSPK